MKSAKGAPSVIGAKSMKAGATARSKNGVGKSVGKKGMGGISAAASKSGGDAKLVGGKLGK